MRKKRYSFLIFLFLFNSYLYAQHTLSGYIQSANQQAAIVGASVYLTDFSIGVISNEYGYYQIVLPEGENQLEVSQLGFKTKQLILNLSQDTIININLELDVLQEVQVFGGQKKASEKINLVELPVQTLNRVPTVGGEPDVMKALALTPGISNGVEGTSGLYIRGGTPDQNLKLLDGTTVYNANHLFGFLSAFNPESLSSIRLYKGGFPARYGGRVSGVTDIRMREGSDQQDSTRMRIGLLSSSFFKEGPIVEDKLSYMLGFRGSYLSLLTIPLALAYQSGAADTYSTYGMYDVNAKLSYKLSPQEKLYLSVYHSNDLFPLKERIGSQEEDNMLSWRNFTTSLRYRKILSKRLFASFLLARNQYHYRYTLESTNTENPTLDSDFFSASNVREWEASSNFEWIIPTFGQLNFGTELKQYNFQPGQAKFRENGIEELNNSEIDRAWSAATYLEGTIDVARKLNLNLGLRFSSFFHDSYQQFNVEPRLEFNYESNAQSAIQWNLTRMTQPIHLLTGNGVGLPNDIWVTASAQAPISTAWQTGLAYNTNFKDNTWNFSVEAYYKKMKDLISYKPGANILFDFESEWENLIETEGIGETYGLEFLLQKNKGKLTGWLGYTLSRSFREFEFINFGERFPAKYDRIHDMEMVVNYKINNKWEFNTNLVYATGYAITLPTALGYNGKPIFTSLNNDRAPINFRCDIGFSKHKMTRRGNPATWHFNIYNLTAHRNPFYVEYGAFFGENDGINGRIDQFTLFTFLPSISYALSF